MILTSTEEHQLSHARIDKENFLKKQDIAMPLCFCQQHIGLNRHTKQQRPPLYRAHACFGKQRTTAHIKGSIYHTHLIP